MAIRMYGQKLPPLPAKTKMGLDFRSGDDSSFYAEGNEDEPLLSKNVGEKKVSDVVRTLKDVCMASSNFCKNNANDKSKIHRISTECGRTSSNTSGTALISSGDKINDITSSSTPAVLESVDKAEQKNNESVPLKDSIRFSDYIQKMDTDPPILEVDSFEVQVSNIFHDQESKFGKMARSMSSTENIKYTDEYVDNVSCPQQRQLRKLKPHQRWPGMSRSRSQPLAIGEEEYSQYWRGDVTVIEMPGAQLPGAELPDLKSEQRLDEKISSSAITKAIVAGNNQLLLECIKQGEDPHLTCKKTGRSYFHVITSSASADHEVKWVPMVYQLSNAGVDSNIKDNEGQSAVRIAIKRRLVQVLAAMLKCGAEFDAADEYHAEQVTGVVRSEIMEVIRRLTPSYWSAIHDTTHFKVNRLIKAWSRVNISHHGQTLIEYAKQNAKDAAIVKLLIQNEASIELAHAVMAGDADRARVILCDSAADLATSDSSVKSNYFEDFAPMTLLGAAIKYEHVHLLKLLKESSKSKQPAIIKTEFCVEASRSKIADDTSFSPIHQDKSHANSTSSLISNAVYNGSTSAFKDPDSVISVMCAIL